MSRTLEYSMRFRNSEKLQSFMIGRSFFLQLVKQGQRKVLWVCDPVGNNGKTWFAQYLNILYAYQLFDDILKARDVCQLIEEDPIGFCFDVCRNDYNVLESL